MDCGGVGGARRNARRPCVAAVINHSSLIDSFQIKDAILRIIRKR